MYRLSDRAYTILAKEVRRQAGHDPVGRVQEDLAMRRLEKLRWQTGTPLTQAEIRRALDDLFPKFSAKAYRNAARANQKPGVCGWIKWVGLGTIAAVGGVWVANLPYPPIRIPVSKTAPILLLPSFFSMDYHYREATALVEQADQLVNNATSLEDIDLGAQKVTAAQDHLDELPVWFLGYYPQRYCTLFECTWQFTVDEFEQSRKAIGRLEAVVFQEKNARQDLEEAETALAEARQRYETAQTQADRDRALSDWQNALDRLSQISNQTLAGRTAQSKLESARRDFQQISGTAAASEQNTTMLEAAKVFAYEASVASQDPPHSATEWQEIVDLWQQAIDRLEEIPNTDPGYLDAQRKLGEYRRKIGISRTNLENERVSSQALERAKELVAQWQAIASTNPTNPTLVSLLQRILNELDKVQSGTTATAEAQTLRQQANSALERVRSSNR